MRRLNHEARAPGEHALGVIEGGVALGRLVIVDDNVNVLPRIRLAFTKAKTADARIYIRLTWRGE